MPLFKRHRDPAPPRAEEPTVDGLADWAASQGWQAAGGAPFDGMLADDVHVITRLVTGAGRSTNSVRGFEVGVTTFGDAFRGSIDARTVIIANSATYVERPSLRASGITKRMAVCAVEVTAELAIACVQPKEFERFAPGIEIDTGNPAFDARFSVAAMPVARPADTAHAGRAATDHGPRRLVVRTRGYLIGCIRPGAFESVDDVTGLIDDVLAVVAAIPASVMPPQVDHSHDDLIARIDKLESADDALALLQTLTPEDRAELAKSNTPLADFADVHTPEEAIARVEALPVEKKLQLFAMFERVEDDTGSS